MVTALAGRPAPPKQVHRSAVPGVIVLVVAAFACWRTPAQHRQRRRRGAELVLGFVALIAAVILLRPAVPGRAGPARPPAPIAVRLALRDLARYRARSGSALAAISLGVLIAVLDLRAVRAAVRERPRLRRAQPGVQPAHRLHAQRAHGAGPARHRRRTQRPERRASGSRMAATARGHRGRARRRSDMHRSSTRPARSLQHAAPRRAAGPARSTWPPRSCCAPSGSTRPQVNPDADILTMRPGLSGMSRCSSSTATASARPRGRRRTARTPSLPGRRVPGQPGDPGGQRAAVRHVGAQHGDHRARGARTLG